MTDDLLALIHRWHLPALRAAWAPRWSASTHGIKQTTCRERFGLAYDAYRAPMKALVPTLS
jgi:hypothetical protein